MRSLREAAPTLRLAAFLLPLLLLTSTGCVGVTTVDARQYRPASIPVRTFPTILVATGPSAEEVALGAEFTGHLASDGLSEVRLVAFSDLEQMRLSGRIPSPSVVVALSLREERTTRADWTTHPVVVCGPGGCYTQAQAMAYDIPVLILSLAVTIFDGPTAGVLQQEELEVSEEGGDFGRMRALGAGRLGGELSIRVDLGVEAFEVELLGSRLPGVEDAIDAIKGGDWAEGRRLLDRSVRSAAFRELEPEDAARVLYDLSLARRFDPETPRAPDLHYALSSEPLREAIALHPAPRYLEALEALEAHSRALEELTRQRTAAAHNFSLLQPGTGSHL